MGSHVAIGPGCCYVCGLGCWHTLCLLVLLPNPEAGRFADNDETGGFSRSVSMGGFVGGKAAAVF